jgi:hypothetical protein
MDVAKAVQLIKGGSSKWIHDSFCDQQQFAWQQGYGAFSVSASQMERVIAYMKGKKSITGRERSRKSFLNFSTSTVLNTMRDTYSDSQPSATRTTDALGGAVTQQYIAGLFSDVR